MRKKSTKEYREELIAKGIEYDLLEEYVSTHCKILHKCRKGHEFKIRPSDILNLVGCSECSGNKQKTTTSYKEELMLNNLDYEVLEEYIGANTPILHKHKKCNYVQKISPSLLLRGKHCAKCAGNNKRTHEEYKQELEKKTPEYEVLVPYINRNKPILHKHKTCGHTWNIRPSRLLAGSGCPNCTSSGFNPNKPATLYYLSVKQGEAYKIGITNRSVSERYSNEELLDITLLKEWYFDNGQEAYDMEQKILNQYKEFRYKGKKLLRSGNTELFFLDVLDLNKPKGN